MEFTWISEVFFWSHNGFPPWKIPTLTPTRAPFSQLSFLTDLIKILNFPFMSQVHKYLPFFLNVIVEADADPGLGCFKSNRLILSWSNSISPIRISKH
jgi:hypothetical protein